MTINEDVNTQFTTVATIIIAGQNNNHDNSVTKVRLS
jgi:hypothetical protein